MATWEAKPIMKGLRLCLREWPKGSCDIRWRKLLVASSCSEATGEAKTSWNTDIIARVKGKQMGCLQKWEFLKEVRIVLWQKETTLKTGQAQKHKRSLALLNSQKHPEKYKISVFTMGGSFSGIEEEKQTEFHVLIGRWSFSNRPTLVGHQPQQYWRVLIVLWEWRVELLNWASDVQLSETIGLLIALKWLHYYGLDFYPGAWEEQGPWTSL